MRLEALVLALSAADHLVEIDAIDATFETPPR
jgi:hypothetical protein